MATVLPCMLVIALGMACVAAPLTTAVLSSVDAVHTGIASGFNSVVARGGGLIATALLGPFHVAMVVCAATAAAAAVCAFIWVRRGNGEGVAWHRKRLEIPIVLFFVNCLDVVTTQHAYHILVRRVIIP